jgi:hypothetical protein
MKITVGQKLWLEPHGNACGRPKTPIKEVEVTKVGRKWFMINKYGRFSIETMWIDGKGYSSDWKAYTSKQELLDNQEADELKRKFNYGRVNWSGLTLNTLRKVNELIEKEGK